MGPEQSRLIETTVCNDIQKHINLFANNKGFSNDILRFGCVTSHCVLVVTDGEASGQECPSSRRILRSAVAATRHHFLTWRTGCSGNRPSERNNFSSHQFTSRLCNQNENEKLSDEFSYFITYNKVCMFGCISSFEKSDFFINVCTQFVVHDEFHCPIQL